MQGHWPRKLLIAGSAFLVLGLLGGGGVAQTSQTPPPSPPAKQKPAAKPKPYVPSAAEISEARQLLDAKGYWVIREATEADASLRHALIAFQKIEGRARTGLLTPEELLSLRQAQCPVALEPTHAHIEIDLDRQVLFVVGENGAVQRILPISSGSGEWFTEGGRTRRALTPVGRFKVQRKIAGWRKSPLGLLYYPSYFHGGVAIHGNPAVPATPASHGCVRIPMFAAKEFFELTPVGTEVLVHGGASTAPAPLLPCAQK